MATELPQTMNHLRLDKIRTLVHYEIILVDDDYFMPWSIDIKTVD